MKNWSYSNKKETQYIHFDPSLLQISKKKASLTKQSLSSYINKLIVNDLRECDDIEDGIDQSTQYVEEKQSPIRSDKP